MHSGGDGTETHLGMTRGGELVTIEKTLCRHLALKESKEIGGRYGILISLSLVVHELLLRNLCSPMLSAYGLRAAQALSLLLHVTQLGHVERHIPWPCYWLRNGLVTCVGTILNFFRSYRGDTLSFPLNLNFGGCASGAARSYHTSP